jgi:hypothetical protein
MRRLLSAVTVMLAAAMLAGCTPGPQREPLESAIPSALLASDLGITKAEASVDIDGLSSNLSVFAVFDRDTVSSDDLRTIVELAVENTDRDNLSRIHIGGRDGSVDGYEYIDLGPVGRELGFAADPVIPDRVSIAWDDAVALAGD